MSNKTGRPAGPAKTLWRKRLTADEIAAVEAFLDDAVVYVTAPDAHTPQTAAIPSKHAGFPSTMHPEGHAGVLQNEDGTAALAAGGAECVHEWCVRIPGMIHCRLCGVENMEKNLTAAPSGSSQGAWAGGNLGPLTDMATLMTSEAVAAKNLGLTALHEQLALQTKRADELQVVVDEQQHLLDRKEVELEQLMQVGGTERQSAYIARLLAKITALGGNRNEFDQEGGR